MDFHLRQVLRSFQDHILFLRHPYVSLVYKGEVKFVLSISLYVHLLLSFSLF